MKQWTRSEGKDRKLALISAKASPAFAAALRRAACDVGLSPSEFIRRSVQQAINAVEAHRVRVPSDGLRDAT